MLTGLLTAVLHVSATWYMLWALGQEDATMIWKVEKSGVVLKATEEKGERGKADDEDFQAP